MSIPLFFSGNRASAWTPRNLFTAGEQGAWYDPSDMATLYQDSAGTTPVTAVEQPVGLMRDKSGRGNHATASADANRPTLSARYNLLTKTEDFSNAAWTKSYLTAADANTLTETTDNNYHAFWPNYSTLPNNTVTAGYFEIGVGTRRYVICAVSSTAAHGYGVCVDTTTGTIVKSMTGSTSGTLSSSSITKVGSVITVRISGYFNTGNIYIGCNGSDTDNPSSFFPTYVGDGSTIIVYKTDLRVANESASLPAYQRVNTSTDYDVAGFPPYLAFNGTNSYLVLADNALSSFGASNFPFAMFAGVRAYTADYGVVFALANNTQSPASDNDYLLLDWSNAAPQARGATRAYTGSYLDKIVVADHAAAPCTFVHTWVRSATTGVARVNGVNGTALDQTLPALTLIAGRIGNRKRGTAAEDGYLNGRIYSLIVRGAATSAADIVRAENYVNLKSGRVY